MFIAYGKGIKIVKVIEHKTEPSIWNSGFSPLVPFPRRLTSAYLLNCSITCLQLGSLSSIYHLSPVRPSSSVVLVHVMAALFLSPRTLLHRKVR